MKKGSGAARGETMLEKSDDAKKDIEFRLESRLKPIRSRRAQVRVRETENFDGAQMNQSKSRNLQQDCCTLLFSDWLMNHHQR